MADNVTSEKQTEAILHAQDFFKILKTRWKEALFVFLLILLSSIFVTMVMEKKYTTSMQIEIKQPGETIDVSAATPTRSSVSAMASSEYIVTQFEVMVSQRNLIQVAKNLNLPGVDAYPESVAAGLAGCIKMEPIRGTNMVQLIVTHPNQADVAKICREVVMVYQSMRDEEEKKLYQDAVDRRNKAYKDAEAVLAKKQAALDAAIKKNNFLFTGSLEAGDLRAASGVTEEINALRQRKQSLENELAHVSVHIDTLDSKSVEDLLTYVINTQLETVETPACADIRRLNEELRALDKDVETMKAQGFGMKHPRMLPLLERMDSLKNDMQQKLDVWKKELEPVIQRKRTEITDLSEKITLLESKQREESAQTWELRRANAEYVRARDNRNELERLLRSEEMREKHSERSTAVVSYSKPVEPRAPSSPNLKLNLIIGVVVGLISGCIVAFIYNYFDTSVKSLEDAERHLSLPVLGVIPQDVSLLALSDGDSPDAEAYRILRTNLELKKSLYRAKSFAIVSANAGEGKSTTLSNLAYVYASAGFNVLMIDADMRRPRLARYLEMEGMFGLSNYLTSDIPLQQAVFRTEIENLYLMPSGPQPVDPSGILSSQRMDQLLSEATKRFDVVLVDSPPVLGVADASILVSKVDATIVVLQPRKMPVKALLRTKSIINNVGGQIIGLVMNNVDISADTQYQYYTTYYSYYSTDEAAPDAKLKSKKRSAVTSDTPVAVVPTSSSQRNSSESVDSDVY